MLKKQILFYFLVYLQIANLWFINKNIFHGNGNGIDWNFIGNCSVKITLLSKYKSRIFNKIFNSKIFSNPELGKIVKLIMITYNIHWLIIKKNNNCKIVKKSNNINKYNRVLIYKIFLENRLQNKYKNEYI